MLLLPLAYNDAMKQMIKQCQTCKKLHSVQETINKTVEAELSAQYTANTYGKNSSLPKFISNNNNNVTYNTQCRENHKPEAQKSSSVTLFHLSINHLFINVHASKTACKY